MGERALQFGTGIGIDITQRAEVVRVLFRVDHEPQLPVGVQSGRVDVADAGAPVANVSQLVAHGSVFGAGLILLVAKAVVCLDIDLGGGNSGQIAQSQPELLANEVADQRCGGQTDGRADQQRDAGERCDQREPQGVASFVRAGSGFCARHG